MRLFIALIFLVSAAAAASNGLVTSNVIKSSSWLDAMKSAAGFLNVQPPGSWSSLMNPSSTTGSSGHTKVGFDTYKSVMAGWPIPAEFRTSAEASVGALVLAAAEGQYVGQAFVFNVKAGQGQLTTLIVVAKRDGQNSSTPATPVDVAYFLLTSSCGLKQQYTQVHTKHCWHCSHCAWLKKCCCRDDVTNVARGDTPQEINVVAQRLEADQYAYFMAHLPSLSSAVRGLLLPTPVSGLSPADLLQVVETYLTRADTVQEVTQTYSDDVITTVQNNTEKLHTMTSNTHLAGVQDKDFSLMMTTMADAFGVKAMLAPFIEVDRVQNVFSHEFMVSVEQGLQYVWIFGERFPDKNNQHNVYLASTRVELELNVTSTVSVMRTSVPEADGSFAMAAFNQMQAPWPQSTLVVTCDLLRFVAAQVIAQQTLGPAALARPDTEYWPLRIVDSVEDLRASPMDSITAITGAIKEICSTWQDIVNAFKTSVTVTVERVTRFGFNYFHEKSTVLHAAGVAQDKVQQFIQLLLPAFNIPDNAQTRLLLFELDYAINATWDADNFAYAIPGTGSDKALMLFKTGDLTTGLASFFVVNIEADFTLAPDLLVVRTQRSVLGGIFSSDKTRIEEVPHVLTPNEAWVLQQFFKLIAMGKMAEVLGIPFQYPVMPTSA